MLNRLRRLGESETGRGLAAATLAGLFLALTNAYGDGDAGLAVRVAYWLFVMTMGWLWAGLSAATLSRLGLMPVGRFAQFLLITAVITGPLTLFIWGLSGLVFAGELQPWTRLPDYAWRVALISAAMTGITLVLEWRGVETHAGPAPSRFLERLPPKLRGARLVAVQAEDHYLRLHTDRGSDLILMRLSDALTELEGLEGAQTHRSWWVSKDAVRDVERGDGRASLTLEGGLTVPVSRRHARALRAAGWW
jgi:hypothetical protein